MGLIIAWPSTKSSLVSPLCVYPKIVLMIQRWKHQTSILWLAYFRSISFAFETLPVLKYLCAWLLSTQVLAACTVMSTYCLTMIGIMTNDFNWKRNPELIHSYVSAVRAWTTKPFDVKCCKVRQIKVTSAIQDFSQESLSCSVQK